MNKIVRILASAAVLCFSFFVAGSHAEGTMGKPNIVFILTDDPSSNLVQGVPEPAAPDAVSNDFRA